MKSRPFAVLFALAGALKNAVVAQEPSGCYTNFTEIGEIEDYADVQQVRTYVLCPNSVFPIASITEGGDLIGKFAPLAIRANMRILCGEDGRVENNCLLQGGSFGAAAFLDLYGFEYLENVFISGLTFDNHKLYGVLFLLPGSVTFYDCVFKNMGNLAPSLSLWYPEDFFEPSETRRVQQKTTIKSWRPRHLQEFSPVYRNPTPDDILHVSYINCEFLHNYAVRLPANEGLPGVVVAQGITKTTVRNTKFENNTYPAKGRYDVGFIILQDDGNIEVENSCFVDNYVDGPAPIVVLFGGVSTTSNEMTSTDPNATNNNRCELIAQFSALDQGLAGPINQCTEATGAGICSSLPTIPHSLPTMAPTNSLAPSMSPIPTMAPSASVAPTGQPTAKPTAAPTTGVPTPSPTEEVIDPDDDPDNVKTAPPTAPIPVTPQPTMEPTTIPPTETSGAQGRFQVLLPLMVSVGAALVSLC